MRLTRRLLQILTIVCILIVGAASAAIIATQTRWFKDWLRGAIVRQSGDYLNAQLSIGSLRGNLLSGIALDDVNVAMEGARVVHLDAVRIDYDAVRLMRGRFVIDRVVIERPVVRLERTAQGLNLARLIKPRPDAEGSSSRVIVVRRLDVVDGTLLLDERLVESQAVTVPRRIQSIDLSLDLRNAPDELTVNLTRLTCRTENPSLAVNELTGAIRRTADGITRGNLVLRTAESSLEASGKFREPPGSAPSLHVTVTPSRLTLDEIADIVPPVRGYHLQPGFSATASGPLERLRVEMDVSESQVGRARGDITLDLVEPGQTVRGTMAVEHLNVASIVEGFRTGAGGSADRKQPAAIQSDVTGTTSVDIALPTGSVPLRGTFAVRAKRVKVAEYEAADLEARGRVDGRTVHIAGQAAAYGARARVSGTITSGEQLVFDLSGRASDVDLRRWPASLGLPPVESDVALDYSVRGRGRRLSGAATFSPSTLAGARIGGGTTAEFNVNAGAVGYAAHGEVSELDLQQFGGAFGVAALNDKRYQSSVNATFIAKGVAGGQAPLTVDATAALVDSKVFEAHIPKMDLAVQLADGDAHITSSGEIRDLDPSVVADTTTRLAGRVSGSVDLKTTLRDYAAGVNADSIDIAGSIHLEPSVIGDLPLDSAVVEGEYSRRAGNLARLELEGADLLVTAHGPISLAETGSTDVMFHADGSSLERIGEIVGKPLKGGAVVDGTVTGNGENLEIRGKLSGSHLGYGDSEALGLTSEFGVVVPELTPARMAVKASSVATFLEIRGQTVNELAADTTFSESRLEFTARAQHGVRRLEAGGTAIFHPDHQEIHLPRLALQSEQIEWRTPDGSHAAIRYFEDRIEVDDLQLTSADQSIRADGVLGSESQPLHVTVENVNIAEVDQLLLGDGRLAGRFGAEAAIAGPLSEPRIEADFRVTQGAFRKFAYESLTGRIDYGGRGAMVDVRLQANPAEWLAVKGFAPLTLLRPNPPDSAGTHEEPVPGEAVDLQVSSSEIGLGLVQAFTPYLTKVTGVLQANLTVTGSGHDPHLGGNVSVRGGSFAVPELGTAYSGLDTDIALSADGVTIREFKILDDRGFPMTVGGTLAMHARSVGAVNITLASSKFEVVDNKMADLKLNTNMQITGDLRKPRVVGSIEVENGTVHLAELIERVTSSAYATRPSNIPGLEAAPPARVDAPSAEPGPSEPGVFDAIDLDVALSVPSNLVLRGRDIRTGNAPVSLGDINLTVGGKLQVRKAPAEPLRLIGDINTVRGTYTFQGRRFEVTRGGRIGFSGGEEIDPLLDLQAQRTISGVETFVRVRGTMKKPEIAFASNPPLEDADILSLIVFNQPVNELGEGEQVSLARRAGALASGYLTSNLTKSIGNALELDEFEIQALDETGSPSVRVGEQVGRNLFFLVRQAFGTEQTTELILEYQIAEFLRLQATGAQGAVATERVQFRRVERAGLDLLFSFTY